MFCSQCGAKLEQDAQFCSACGKPIAVRATVQEEPARAVVPPVKQALKQRMRNIFFALVAAIVVTRGLYRGNFGIALGAAMVEIPVSILLGRAGLWFFDQIALFYINFRNPDSPKKKFDRDLWTVLVWSLLVGEPLWAIGKYDWSR